MFKVRLRSGIILLALAVLFLVLGGPVLFVVSLLISLIGMSELYRILDFEKQLLGVVAYLGAGAYYLCLYFGQGDLPMMALIFALMAILAVYVFTYPRYQAMQVMMAFFGIVYVAVMLSYMYQIRRMEGGMYLVWLVFISSWGCDTCAYCAGVLLGKHKMAPVLSPKKSVEGAVGGVLGAALIGAIYGMVFKDRLTIFVHPALVLALIGAVGGLISMVGDLAASAIKRNFEIKDYGTLIPGHGGILDRFDSVIITGPLVFYLILLLRQIG